MDLKETVYFLEPVTIANIVETLGFTTVPLFLPMWMFETTLMLSSVVETWNAAFLIQNPKMTASHKLCLKHLLFFCYLESL